MIRVILLIHIIICLFNLNVSAQLPTAAQQLYDSAFAQDSTLVQYALDSGVQVLATPDSSTFYLQWFPPGVNPAATPLIVTLHGSHCNAFMEFKSWYPKAQLHGCGIIALQWYRYSPNPPYDYIPDDTLYRYIDSALTKINYPAGRALLHGFSRGGARSYAMILKDILSGKNYFCTTIANSGDANLSYPLYDSIDVGAFGPTVFAGKRWNLFCGGLDTIVGCIKMTNTQAWLQSQGATVDIFIQDPALGHDGFQLQSSFAYKDSVLDNYHSCFNSSLIVEPLKKSQLIFYPNPFSVQTTFHADIILKNATLTIFNSFGQKARELDNLFGQTIILNRDNLSDGLYFIQLTMDNEIISKGKLVICE